MAVVRARSVNGLVFAINEENFREKARRQDVIVLNRVQVTARESHWPRAEDAHNVPARLYSTLVLCGVHS